MNIRNEANVILLFPSIDSCKTVIYRFNAARDLTYTSNITFQETGNAPKVKFSLKK